MSAQPKNKLNHDQRVNPRYIENHENYIDKFKKPKRSKTSKRSKRKENKTYNSTSKTLKRMSPRKCTTKTKNAISSQKKGNFFPAEAAYQNLEILD